MANQILLIKSFVPERKSYLLAVDGHPLMLSVLGSRTGVCSYGNINATSIWAPVLCPLENECMNGRHNCTINEVCVDLEYGFHCKCKPGYKRDNR